MAGEIKKTLEDLKTRFPRDMDYTVSLDTTLPVAEGINEIVHTLFEAVVLVIIVVFIFLQNWRATLIPLLTVPVSLVGAFIFFPLLGFSINVLSLLGLVLAIGIVVDDAIVVVEAVMHHIEHGMDAEGRHVQGDGGSVGAGRGDRADPGRGVRAGRLHGRHHRPALPAVRDHDRDLGAAVGVQRADAVAGARGAAAQAGDRQEDAAHAVLPGLQQGVRRGHQRLRQLAGFLVRKLVVSVVLVGVFVFLTVRLVGRIPGGFVPEEDQGYILVNAPLPDASSLERTDAVMRKVEKILAENEGVEGYNTITGFSLLTGAYSSNMGFFFVELKQWEERHTAGDCTPTA